MRWLLLRIKLYYILFGKGAVWESWRGPEYDFSLTNNFLFSFLYVGMSNYSLFANTFRYRLVLFRNQSLYLKSKLIGWFL